ncbi:MAG: hypothetical protein K8U03_22795 [Planctomycetia bacterium]|nr:hypothetical protein [Planctomycetia bacterium]
MRRIFSIGPAILVLAGLSSAPLSETSQADEVGNQEKAASVWMKKKLDYSQEILAGIAIADFDRVAAAAANIKTLNKIEAFVRGRNPAYNEQLKAFQDSNEEILRQAAAKNVDGAAAALSQMTTSCIRCHKVLRDQPAK